MGSVLGQEAPTCTEVAASRPAPDHRQGRGRGRVPTAGVPGGPWFLQSPGSACEAETTPDSPRNRWSETNTRNLPRRGGAATPYRMQRTGTSWGHMAPLPYIVAVPQHSQPRSRPNCAAQARTTALHQRLSVAKWDGASQETHQSHCVGPFCPPQSGEVCAQAQ